MAERHPLPEAVEIDTARAHPSRVYDYMLGGHTNFQVDRDAAERGAAALLGGFDRGCKMVRDQRGFLRSAIEWLATEAEMRQFLDVGTGVPNADNVHGVARLAAPDARIVYVDNDPIVLAHAAELLVDDDVTAYVHEDLRHPERILRRAAATLDFREPVGLVLVGVLHLIEDRDDPWGLVAELVDALAVGSYVVISHMASDIEAEMTEAAERANATMRDPFVLRDRAEVVRFLYGLDVIEPGLVTVDRWSPDGRVREVAGPVTPFYAAVGQKFEGGRPSARSSRRGAAAVSSTASRSPRKVATTRLHRDSAVGVAR
jgi:SAM-dependent methyltransferase